MPLFTDTPLQIQCQVCSTQNQFKQFKKKNFYIDPVYRPLISQLYICLHCISEKHFKHSFLVNHDLFVCRFHAQICSYTWVVNANPMNSLMCGIQTLGVNFKWRDQESLYSPAVFAQLNVKLGLLFYCALLIFCVIPKYRSQQKTVLLNIFKLQVWNNTGESLLTIFIFWLNYSF